MYVTNELYLSYVDGRSQGPRFSEHSECLQVALNKIRELSMRRCCHLAAPDRANKHICDVAGARAHTAFRPRNVSPAIVSSVASAPLT
ncbi:unnamed protein product [Arctia plantaginis]|uniref:Uncharacterized protein n=1 Tax=Arctia plantaginis TaxID=874455 RepID=A0A8S1A868_ARCPL|nr:unnamed protein product [Arctia plantaginis]CAB3250966.1 unnamed protein product [Arctia plantaginis]